MKPYAQIGLHAAGPLGETRALPTRVAPRFPYNEIYTGWAYPPKDYAKWAELVCQWGRHSVARYGAKEAESWYWQVWSEANIGH